MPRGSRQKVIDKLLDSAILVPLFERRGVWMSVLSVGVRVN